MTATSSPAGRVPLDHPLLGHWLSFTRDQLAHVEQLVAYGDWVPLRFPPLGAVLVNHPALRSRSGSRASAFCCPTGCRCRPTCGCGARYAAWTGWCSA